MLIKIFICLIFIGPFGYYYNRLLSDTVGVDYNYLVIIFSILMFLGLIKNISKKEFKYLTSGFIIITPFALGLLWTEEFYRGLHFTLILFGTLILSFVLYKYDIIFLMWKSFSFGVVCFSILYLFGFLSISNEYNFGGERVGYVTSDIYYLDPNWLGYWCVIAIFYFLGVVFKSPNRIIVYFYLFILVSVMVGTQSRSALFALVISIIIIVFLKRKLLFGIIMTLFSMLILLVMTITSVETRYFNESIIGSSRTDLIHSTIDAIKNSSTEFLIGYGTGGGDLAIGYHYPGAVLFSDGLYRYNNHNTPLDIVLQIGLLGWMILGILTILFIIIIKKAKKDYITVAGLLLFVIIQALVYNPIKDGIILIAFSIILAIYLKLKITNNNIISKEV